MPNVILALGILLLLVTRANGQASGYSFSYSGRLTDDTSGKPVDGPVALQVAFYHDATGGTPILTLTNGLSAVPLADGLFQITVTLAPADFQNVFASVEQAVYVEITDLTHRPTTPYERQIVSMIPYAAKVPVDGKTLAFDSVGQLALNVAGTPSAGQTLAADGAGGLVWAPAAGAATSISGVAVGTSAPSSGELLRFNGTQWVASPDTSVNRAGDTDLGSLGLGPQATLGLGQYTNAQESSLTTGLTAADKGKVWFNVTTNQMKYWDGSTAAPLGVSGSGLTDFNGQTGNTQLLAIGTSGPSPGWVSAADTHTLNVPLASAAGVTAGLLSNADYNSFGAKQSAISGTTVVNAGTYVANLHDGVELKPYGTTAGQTGELRFDPLSGSNYVGLKAPDAVPASLVWTLPGADGASGQVLATNGAGGLGWTSPLAGNNGNQAITNVAGLSIGTSAPGTDLYFGAGANRAVQVQSVGAGGGDSLTIQAGGTTATNQDGGDLVLASGTANGTGASGIQLQTASGGAPVTAMTILGNGYVGIGTTLPGDALDVVGTGDVQTNDIRTTITDGFVLKNTTPSDGTNTVQYSPSLRFSGAAWNAVGSVSQTSDFAIYANPLAATVAQGSLFFDFSGNGGAFSHLATLNSGGSFSSNYLAANGSQSYGFLTWGTSAAGNLLTRNTADAYPVLAIQQANAGSSGDILQLKNDSSTVMTVQRGGNVGIGTTAPQATLDVNGAVRAGSFISTSGSSDFSAQAVGNVGSLSIGTTAAGSDLLFGAGANRTIAIQPQASSGNSLTIQAGGSTVAGDSGGNLTLASGATAVGATSYSQIDFQTSSSGATTNAMTILGNGYVGIGTTNPQQLLDVNGHIHLSHLHGILERNVGNTGDYYLMQGSTTDQVLIANSAMELSSGGGATTLFVGNNNGNVGIGVSSPVNKLDVAGSAAFGTYAGTLVGTSDSVIVGGSVGIGTTAPQATLDVNGAVRAASFISTSGSSNFSAQLVANVGSLSIGTTAAGSDLLFGAGADRTIGVQSQAANGSNLTIQAGGTTVAGDSGGNLTLASGVTAIGATSASQINFQTSNSGTPTKAMTILGNGYVGIGSTSPAYALDVVGDINTSVGVRLLTNYVVTTGTPAGYTRFGNAAGTQGLNFWAGGGEKMHVDTAGHVGIGTSTPAGLLDVEGSGGVILNAGNVGIGTTSSSYALQIAPNGGTAGSTLFVQDQTPTTGVTQILAKSGAGQTTSGTLPLLIQNNGGGTIFSVDPYGAVVAANGYGGAGMTSGAAFTLTGNRLNFNGSTVTATAGTANLVNVTGTVAPTSGTVGVNAVSVVPTVNQTGGANGTTRGIYVNPTLTSAPDFRAIETVTGNVILGSAGGNVGIGTTNPGASLDVHGHIASSSAAATVGTCGTSPSISGNDSRGTATTGSSSTSSCQITFASAYPTAPFCTVAWNGTGAPVVGLSEATTTTTLTVYFSAGVTTATFSYLCMQ